MLHNHNCGNEKKGEKEAEEELETSIILEVKVNKKKKEHKIYENEVVEKEQKYGNEEILVQNKSGCLHIKCGSKCQACPNYNSKLNC